jgi:hypothetical protein
LDTFGIRVAVAIALLLAVVLMICAVRRVRRANDAARHAVARNAGKHQIATIEEEMRFTAVGVFCWMFFVAGILVLMFGDGLLSGDARLTVLAFTGLCAFGAVLGRCRILIVYRTEPREE